MSRELGLQLRGSEVFAFAQVFSGDAYISLTPINRPKPDFTHDFWALCSCGRIGWIRFNPKDRTYGPDVSNPEWKIGIDPLGWSLGWSCGHEAHCQCFGGLGSISLEARNQIEAIFGICPQGEWANIWLHNFGR